MVDQAVICWLNNESRGISEVERSAVAPMQALTQQPHPHHWSVHPLCALLMSEAGTAAGEAAAAGAMAGLSLHDQLGASMMPTLAPPKMLAHTTQVRALTRSCTSQAI